MRQFADQVRIRLTLQLTKGISRVLQKLCKYFKGTAISAFKIPASLVLSKNLYLSVNDSESLQNWHRLLDVFEKLSFCSIKLYISITTSRYVALSNCVLFISPIQLVKGAKFLSTTCLSFLPVWFAALVAPTPTTVMFPLITSIHALL